MTPFTFNPPAGAAKPPPSRDAEVKIAVTPDGMQAFLSISSPQGEGKEATVMDVVRALRENKIEYGIRGDIMQALALKIPYGQRLVIANGTPSGPGVDSSIEYHFELTKRNAPALLPDGSVDFKNLGLIQNVTENQLLCTKIPAREGTSGTNVFGHALPSRMGRDHPLPAGKNTRLSDDGQFLFAACNGAVDIIGRHVRVMNTYEVRCSVSHATGNIEFLGNVVVHGDVMPGFAIQADGNVVVGGTLDGGTIIAAGNVDISDGIVNGIVDCGGALRAKYVQGGTLTVKGAVEVGSILNSTIRCGEEVHCVGRYSSIMASYVSARHAIECRNVGGRSTSAPATLEVGADTGAGTRLRQLPTEMINLKKLIDEDQKLVTALEKMIANKTITPARVKLYGQLRERMKLSTAQMESLSAEKEELEKELVTNGYGEINVTGTIMPGTTIAIGPERRVLQNPVQKLLFVRRPEQGLVVSAARTAKQ